MSRRPRDAVSGRFRVPDGKLPEVAGVGNAKGRGRVSNAVLFQGLSDLRTLPNCMPPRMTGDSCRPRASNRTLVGKLPPNQLAKRTEAATEFQ